MKTWSPLLLLLTASLTAAAAKNAEVPALPVQKIQQVDDFQIRHYPGRVTAISQVNVVSRVNGEILKVGFKNGTQVKKGETLFLLDSVKYRAAVRNAEAAVAEYKAKTDYAQSSYARNERLAKSKAVSQDTFESAASVRAATAALLAAAEAELVSAQDDLAHCTVTSPIAGRIGSAAFTEGNYVTPSSGILATVVQTDPIRVRFAISSRDYLTMFDGRNERLCAHGKVTLTLGDGRAYPHAGIVEYTENRMDDATDTVVVFARFPNAGEVLLPGGTVQVTLRNAVGAKRIAVPLSALMQDVKGTYVWVVRKNDTVEKRYVVRDAMVQERLLIRSGLAAGEEVVTDGTHKVRAGEKIVPVRR